MPVDFDRYMVGYAASAYLDDAFDLSLIHI